MVTFAPIGDIEEAHPDLELITEAPKEVKESIVSSVFMECFQGNNTFRFKHWLQRLNRASAAHAIRSFDSFLVKVEEGDYKEVWGFYGNTAYTHKQAYRIL